MVKVNVNFKDSKHKDNFASSGVVPEGWHNAKITKAELKESRKDPAKKYINFEFSVEGYNQKCFFNAFVNGLDNNDAIFTILQALGTEPQNAEGSIDTKDFLGHTLQIDVKHKVEPDAEGREWTNLKLNGVRPYSPNKEEGPFDDQPVSSPPNSPSEWPE